MKKMSIAEKKQALKMQAERLSVIEDVLEYLDRELIYKSKHDIDGNTTPPCEDDYTYDAYIAIKSVYDDILALC